MMQKLIVDCRDNKTQYVTLTAEEESARLIEIEKANEQRAQEQAAIQKRAQAVERLKARAKNDAILADLLELILDR